MVQRSNNNSNSNGGVSYANANNAASNSNANYGSRLANRNVSANKEMNVLGYGIPDVSGIVVPGEMSLANPVAGSKKSRARGVAFGRLILEEGKPQN